GGLLSVLGKRLGEAEQGRCFVGVLAQDLQDVVVPDGVPDDLPEGGFRRRVRARLRGGGPDCGLGHDGGRGGECCGERAEFTHATATGERGYRDVRSAADGERDTVPADE